MILAAAGKLTQAVEELRQLRREAKQRDAQALVMQLDLDLAETLGNLGKREEARTAFEQAIELERTLPPDVVTKGGAEEVSAAGVLRRGGRWLASRWDLFTATSSQLDGYGRYSYVLYANPPKADDPFLLDLFQGGVLGNRVGEERSGLNLFYVPVRESTIDDLNDDAFQTQGRAEPNLAASKVAAAYDTRLAQDMLGQICSHAAEKLDACAKPIFDNGPYILVMPEPWGRYTEQSSVAMLLPLSGYQPAISDAVFHSLLDVVQDTDSKGMTRLTKTQLIVADALVRAGGIAQSVVQSMVQLASLRSH